MVHPNTLSRSRIWAAILLPLLFYFLLNPDCRDCLTIKGVIRAVLVVVMFMTDWLDGRIARKRNLQSEYGAWLDQFSDKVLVTSLSIYFWFFEPVLWWPLVALLLFREWGILYIRSKTALPVQWLGKTKLWVQGVSFALLALGLHSAGSFIYFLVLVLAYWSAFYYVKQAIFKTI